MATQVLLLTNSVAIGGMEEHVRLLAAKLDRARFEVHVVYPDAADVEPFAPALKAASDHMARITPDRRDGPRRELTEVARLWWYAVRHRIQVAHVHSTTFTGADLSVLALRLAGVRRVFMTEHLAPEGPVARQLRIRRDLTVRLLKGVVCVSELNRQRRGAAFRNPTGRTHVVNNGVDIARFDRLPAEELQALRRSLALPDDALVVGTAIRLEPEKAVDDLVAAFALVRRQQPTAHLLVAGDGTERAALERQALELGVADACRFVGFQSDPRPYISLMDVFVLPVPFGSASIGLLEAMALGRACVISFGGEGEAVVPGENGYWAEPRDPTSLADCIVRIIGDPERRAAFGQAARRRVDADYSADSVARQLGSLYLRR